MNGVMIVGMVFLIPLAGIAFAGFQAWLKFRERQEMIGSSTKGLEKTVAALREENTDLVRRLENLEAIVTSRLWETTRNQQVAPADVARLDIMTSEIPDELPPVEKAHRLAEKLSL